jgi:hypothetical protein
VTTRLGEAAAWADELRTRDAGSIAADMAPAEPARADGGLGHPGGAALLAAPARAVEASDG